MMSYAEAPTINEIIYWRESRSRNNIISMRPSLYKVGQIVRFRVDTLMRVGRISNAMCYNGVCTYHICTNSGVWYREIPQDAIISVLQMNWYEN